MDRERKKGKEEGRKGERIGEGKESGNERWE